MIAERRAMADRIRETWDGVSAIGTFTRFATGDQVTVYFEKEELPAMTAPAGLGGRVRFLSVNWAEPAVTVEIQQYPADLLDNAEDTPGVEQ